MASTFWTQGPSGLAGGETPTPFGRAPRGRRRWLALTAAGLLVGAAGFTQGASTAIGIDGFRALAGEGLESPPAARTHRHDRLEGAFWAPAGSAARPPEPRVQGRRWTPAPVPGAAGTSPLASRSAREEVLRTTSGSPSRDQQGSWIPAGSTPIRPDSRHSWPWAKKSSPSQ